ncbi:hypothetical protein D3C86_1509450 [compost metagenome]
MSSMRSASSSTSTSTSFKSRLPAFNCSIIRPGVPIRMSGTLRSIAAWTLKSSPPVIRPDLMKVNCEKRSTSFRVCWASSRVGSRIRVLMLTRIFAGPIRRLRMGKTNAAVLPLPVCAVTRRSRPWSASGMAAACTGVGSTNFSSATALSRRSCRANWENTGATSKKCKKTAA